MFGAFMMRILPTLVAALAGLLIAGGVASAHPHVWVTMKSSVVYGPDGAAIGVRHSWKFDDMYSAFAIQGLDHKDKDNFTSEELQPLAKVNVESLKEYDFFTFAKADNKKAEFTDPVDYHLDFNAKDTVLTLHFLLPFKTPVKSKTLRLEIFDPEYFVDFELDPVDPVALDHPPAGCELTLGKPQELTAEMARKLAVIPADGKIPSESYGAAFANKIMVRCP